MSICFILLWLCGWFRKIQRNVLLTFLSQPITLLLPTYTLCKVPVLRPMDLMVEATPRRVFSNAHTYHINSISVNSDNETYMSTDDLRINLWNLEITNRSFSILLPVYLTYTTFYIETAKSCLFQIWKWTHFQWQLKVRPVISFH